MNVGSSSPARLACPGSHLRRCFRDPDRRPLLAVQEFAQSILKLAVRDDVRFGDEKRVAAQFTAALDDSFDAVGEAVKMDVRLPTIRLTGKEVAFSDFSWMRFNCCPNGIETLSSRVRSQVSHSTWRSVSGGGSTSRPMTVYKDERRSQIRAPISPLAPVTSTVPTACALVGHLCLLPGSPRSAGARPNATRNSVFARSIRVGSRRAMFDPRD